MFVCPPNNCAGFYDPGRRTAIPAPGADNSHIGIMTILYNNIGKDLSRVSMPIALNEPVSLLQRLSEELEYSELLDIANHIEDPFERMVSLAYLESRPPGAKIQWSSVESSSLLKKKMSTGLCGSVLHLWICLGILEVSLQTL